MFGTRAARRMFSGEDGPRPIPVSEELKRAQVRADHAAAARRRGSTPTESLRAAPGGAQALWAGGLVAATCIVFPGIHFVGAIAIAPLWRLTWRALASLPSALEEEE